MDEHSLLLIAGGLVGAALLVAVTIAVLALVRGGRPRPEIAEITGRLAQMAELQAVHQGHLAERLQAQERALALGMEQRLSDLTRRVSDTLRESSERTHTNLADLKARLAVIDAAQRNITELSTQVTGLQEVLSNKQARGAFGEIQLQDLVKAALPPSAYEFQATLGSGRRADCLVKLPNPPGSIVIDAKFPLEGYRALREARDEAATVVARREFAAAVRGHVRTIAEKYIVAGETAESALMFVPSEAVYAELHSGFTAVVEDSFRARVWIVSPTTLMATLTTVRAVLKDVRMREQAHVIQREVTLLGEDVLRLDERVGKLQRHFAQAEDDLKGIRTSAEKVTKRAERIEELQLGEPPAAPVLAELRTEMGSGMIEQP